MKKRKIRWDNVIVLGMMLTITLAFIFILTDTIKWNIDNKKLKQQIDDIQSITPIKEIKDTSIPNTPDNQETPNLYIDYSKMNMIDVDFKELKKKNQDVKGWILLNGTKINYPFVQTSDNKYYLTHSFDKSHNDAGWVFLDYRNNELNDKNTILYAHRRNDKTMFGSLKDILTNGWLNNKENHILKIATENENSIWQVFSIYHIKTTSDYLKTEFHTEKEYLAFLNMIQQRSIHNFHSTVNENDQIITLSTCYNSSEKLVLHAKLIKRTSK